MQNIGNLNCFHAPQNSMIIEVLYAMTTQILYVNTTSYNYPMQPATPKQTQRALTFFRNTFFHFIIRLSLDLLRGMISSLSQIILFIVFKIHRSAMMISSTFVSCFYEHYNNKCFSCRKNRLQMYTINKKKEMCFQAFDPLLSVELAEKMCREVSIAQRSIIL